MAKDKTEPRARKDGAVYERPGVAPEQADRVFDRLLEKGYIDDERFARFWIENRHLRKGASRRKLVQELRAKGVESSIIEANLEESTRTDTSELRKMIEKKASRYADRQKLMQYLVRQGFSYDDVKTALVEFDQTE